MRTILMELLGIPQQPAIIDEIGNQFDEFIKKFGFEPNAVLAGQVAYWELEEWMNCDSCAHKAEGCTKGLHVGPMEVFLCTSITGVVVAQVGIKNEVSVSDMPNGVSH